MEYQGNSTTPTSCNGLGIGRSGKLKRKDYLGDEDDETPSLGSEPSAQPQNENGATFKSSGTQEAKGLSVGRWQKDTFSKSQPAV